MSPSRLSKIVDRGPLGSVQAASEKTFHTATAHDKVLVSPSHRRGPWEGHMRRREFLAGLIGAASVWPVPARTQQIKPAIGFLNGGSIEGYAPYVAAFREGLRQSGYVEGENVVIEYRWAEGRYNLLRELVDDLVKRNVAVIVANTPANLEAKKATDTIPVVFTTGSDPVQIGLVSNLSRPGGNVTGVSQLGALLGPKRLELAHELFPNATDAPFMINPTDPQRAEKLLIDAQAVAKQFGLKLRVLRASSEPEIEAAFSSFSQFRGAALVIGSDTLYTSETRLLAELSLRYAVPTIYEYIEFVRAGGLMGYGGNIKESYRWAGIYAGRILKGEKPADLPVQQSTTVELMVNLKTAKILGVTVPQTLLARADEVIE
jgi:putative ABC transport system substrate-binding protein